MRKRITAAALAAMILSSGSATAASKPRTCNADLRTCNANYTTCSGEFGTCNAGTAALGDVLVGTTFSIAAGLDVTTPRSTEFARPASPARGVRRAKAMP